MEDRLQAITLQKLRVLAAIAGEKSFAKAADLLYLSSPAVSEHIKSLEDIVGARLLQRSRGNRLIRLTEAGQILLDSYSEISESLQRAARALESIKRLEGGTVALGVGLTHGSIIFPAVDKFLQTNPDIGVNIEINQSPRILEDLKAHRLDLAITLRADELAGFVSEPLVSRDIFPVGLPGHRLAGASPAAFRELALERLVLGDRSNILRKVLERRAAEAGITLNVAIEVPTIEARLQAVWRGLGITMISPHLLATADVAQLCVLNVQGFPVRMRLFIVHLPTQLSPGAQALKDYLLEYRSMLV